MKNSAKFIVDNINVSGIKFFNTNNVTAKLQGLGSGEANAFLLNFDGFTAPDLDYVIEKMYFISSLYVNSCGLVSPAVSVRVIYEMKDTKQQFAATISHLDFYETMYFFSTFNVVDLEYVFETLAPQTNGTATDVFFAALNLDDTETAAVLAGQNIVPNTQRSEKAVDIFATLLQSLTNYI